MTTTTTTICSCCHGANHVSTMTDGRTNHLVCDDCREFVNTFFMVYLSMASAVNEVAKMHGLGDGGR